MKIVSTGSIYRIYSDDLKVSDSFIPQVYIVRFSNLSGFFLEVHSDIELYNEKAYGIHLSKVNKVLRSFNKFQRNLGVLLSGEKGIGKSFFSKILCSKAIELDIPVIIIDEFIPGIHSFIEEIDQEVLILFDEFDKTFAERRNDNDNSNPQNTLLSLFDGTSGGKKLYVITCNNFKNLSDFLINRPGRFHYHIRFGYPDAKEIRIFLQDKISEEYWGEIIKVINFAGKVNLNYDCLRAIAHEIQEGEKFEDAIADLNILNTNDQSYNIECMFENGVKMYLRNHYMDLFGNSSTGFWMLDESGNRTGIHVSFNPSKTNYDVNSGCTILKGKENFKLFYDEDYMNEDEIEKIKALVPSYLTISNAKGDKYRYTV